ncbi:MAG: ArsC/Spx/MgsR family protein [Saprospiraceae bacterium]|nr:ArsC/Spx/MgsR family protein [Saprospiraceae bacterium]
MKKIYYLGTCATCKRIIKELDPGKDVEMQDIKKDPITASQLDKMKSMAGSYEKLFSRRSVKYRTMGLKDKELSEKDYRQLILDEYTFLKRPVIIAGDEISVGSAKAEIDKVRDKV